MSFRSKIFYFAFSLCVLAMSGCSEDLSEYRGNSDGTTRVTFRIPKVESFDTRTVDSGYPSTAPKEGEEGKINDFRLIAYKSGSETPMIFNLHDYPENVSGNYREYTIPIEAGEYKFYLFANIDTYLNDDAKNKLKPGSDIREGELPNIQLQFSESHKLRAGDLPLGAFPNSKDIQNLPSSGLFEVVAETTNTVNVNMRFLCSKVRHTILFDNTQPTSQNPNGGISKDFQNNIIEYILPDAEKQPKADNINPVTALEYSNLSSIVDGETLSWPLNIGKYEYPDHSNYPTNSNDKLFDWDDNDNNNWATTGKKAWQYVIYLPENLSGDNTVLHHPYQISGVDENKEHKFTFDGSVNPKLERGMMYDIVTKVVNSDFSDNNTTINIADWNLMELMYELHGPYELIVESPDIQIVSTVRWETMGFSTDVDDDDIEFEFPQIEVNGKMMDFYYSEEIDDTMTDDDGNPYVFNDDWQRHLRIRINPEIPYKVIRELRGNLSGNIKTDSNQKLKEVSYFHIRTGNLHKRIDVTYMELEVYLQVSPQTITIRTYDYYTNGIDYRVGEETENELGGIKIKFSTNFDADQIENHFSVTDPKGLFNGISLNDAGTYYALKFENNTDVRKDGNSDLYKIYAIEGTLNLELRDIIKGNPLWNEDNEFTLTFKLDIGNGTVLTKNVKIIVKPFTSNYVIHFKDKTGRWDGIPHVFIYQDLLMPADLPKYDFTTEEGRANNLKYPGLHECAGKIVGYIEYFENDWNYNAATQYVFSNNISFKGWKGYGGPDDNDPWADPHITYTDKTDPNSTMGFVMFGTKQSDGSWNKDYGYTNRVDQFNSTIRRIRYRFDVNFNEDHERRVNWGLYDGSVCDKCRKRHDGGSRFNSKEGGSDNDYDYPGIQMERETGENAGWWRYTLTGVAQPGQTMIIFANSEEPWDKPDPDDPSKKNQDANRYPSAYETGLPLFDFEDNEGWFVFGGQNKTGETVKTEHHFYDDKPNI